VDLVVLFEDPSDAYADKRVAVHDKTVWALTQDCVPFTRLREGTRVGSCAPWPRS
jgi:hypothetical protein